MSRSHLTAVCGLIAVALAAIIPIAAGSAEPGYAHDSQFISELGAQGAANGALVSLGGFAPIGLLVLAFLAFAHRDFPGGRRKTIGVLGLALVGVAYLVAAAFRCDAGCPASGSVSQSIHNAFGLLEYAGALIGLALLGSAFRASARWRALFPVCAASAVLVGAAFVAMLLPELASVRGSSQRIAETAIFGWIAVVSVSIVVKQPREVQPS